MHRLLQRQLQKFLGPVESYPTELQRLLDAVDQAYVQADNDRSIIERSMDLSSRELIARNKKITLAEAKYRAIFENVAEGIFQTTPEGRYLVANPALARIYGYDDIESFKAAITDIATNVYVDPNRRVQIMKAIDAHGLIRDWESRVYRKDGSVGWITESSRAERDAQGKVLFYEGTVRDITASKQAEKERQDLQERLLVLSRQAGMSEVAIGVLHNVGNVLNSVNVSASLVSDLLRDSQLQGLVKAATLLQSHRDNLADFLLKDNKAVKIADYLSQLSDQLGQEREEIRKEVATLITNVDHIKQVVTMQQSHAKVGGVVDAVDLQLVMEDALRINHMSLTRHGVKVELEFEPIPTIMADKHQIMQILVNLIRNAKQAMRNVSHERRLTLRLSLPASDTSRVYAQVVDTGVGIETKNLTKIFCHGFTTKAEGHGFGLHTSALLAQSMGGTLSAHSDGPGTGAMFTLELPLTSPPDINAQKVFALQHNGH